MLKIYSYIVDHDLGLAPNPFGNYCTLAVCKGRIRSSNNLNIGDWIIGTGSRSLEKASSKKYVSKLIYAMKVEEKLSYNEYWDDPRFQYKKPMINGSLAAMYGDNIYHQDEDKKWYQRDSAHSNQDGSTNIGHLNRDTKGENVLISKHFYYFGEAAPLIPDSILNICHVGVGEKIVPPEYYSEFFKWLTSNFRRGIHGDPANWIIYNQLKLF